MNYKTFVFFMLFLLPTCILSDKKTVILLPVGSWKYDVYVNSEKAGNGSVIRRNLGPYKVKTEYSLTFQSGPLMVVSSEKIIEKSKTYQPVSFESDSKLMTQDAVRSSAVKAVVKNDVLTVKPLHEKKIRLKLKSEIYFGTNIIVYDFLTQGFPEKEIVKDIYDPSIDPSRSLRLKARLSRLGSDTKTSSLYKIEIWDNKRKILSLYVDRNGVIVKYLFLTGKDLVEMVLPSYAP